MLLLDSILLLLILGALHIARIKYPNAFFFCRGAKLFLPPEWDESKKKQEVEVKIIQIQYEHVKIFDMANQYERVLLILIALMIYLPVKAMILCFLEALGFIEFQKLSSTSTFCFIICLASFLYCLKIALKILWISSYKFSYCLAMSFGLNLLFFILRITFQNLGIAQHQLNDATTDYKKHLQLIFGKQSISLNQNGVLFCIFLINMLITLGFVPAILKFGNWYTTTLKEIYYEEDEEDKKNNTDPDRQKKEKQLKIKSKKTIFYLNIYLTTFLAFIFLSHPYFLNFLPESILDCIRLALIGLDIFIICYTLAAAIEFNGSYAYQYICKFFNSQQKSEKQMMLKKVAPYIRQIWYTKFQYMFRIFFTAFICIILVDWKYLHDESSPLEKNPVVSETHCGIMNNQITILQNLFKCDFEEPKFRLTDYAEYGINGAILDKKTEESLTSMIQNKISKYGLLNNKFLIAVFQELLWYHSVTLFATTIVYILFLRKAVYEI